MRKDYEWRNDSEFFFFFFFFFYLNFIFFLSFIERKKKQLTHGEYGSADLSRTKEDYGLFVKNEWLL